MAIYNSLISNQSADDFLFIDEEFSYINQPQELSLQEINFNLRNQMEFGYLGKDKHLYKNISFFSSPNASEKIKGLINPNHPDLKYPYPGKEFKCKCKLDKKTIVGKLWLRVEGRYKDKLKEHENESLNWQKDYANHIDDATQLNAKDLTRAAYNALVKNQSEQALSLAVDAFDKSQWAVEHVMKPHEYKNKAIYEALAIQIIANIKNNTHLSIIEAQLGQLRLLKIHQNFDPSQISILEKVVSNIAKESLNTLTVDNTLNIVDLIGAQVIEALSTQLKSNANFSTIFKHQVQLISHSTFLCAMVQAIFDNIEIIRTHNLWDQVNFTDPLLNQDNSLSNLDKNWFKNVIRESSKPLHLEQRNLRLQYFDNCMKIQLARVMYEIESSIKFKFSPQDLTQNFFESISDFTMDTEPHHPEWAEVSIPAGPTSLTEDFKKLWKQVKQVLMIIIEAKKLYEKTKETFAKDKANEPGSKKK